VAAGAGVELAALAQCRWRMVEVLEVVQADSEREVVLRLR
jgi:hypothetical protein